MGANRFGKRGLVHRALDFAIMTAPEKRDPVLLAKLDAVAGRKDLPLVTAREAAARGTPVLVTHAGKMSRPILERLGFRPVARIDRLLDVLPN